MMRNILLIIIFTTTLTLAQEDHSAFIEGPFDTPREITETCTMCHESGDEVMQSRHWNWVQTKVDSQKDKYVNFGNRNLIFNLCYSDPVNFSSCSNCHISFGWQDEMIDLEDAANINCLVCHDQTGTYKKTPPGEQDTTIDLVTVAQSVGNGLPSIQNCGNCHFSNKSITEISNGSLNAGLMEADMETDVHMGGMEFSCTECHFTDAHNISGGGHGANYPEDSEIVACTNCHSEEPHDKELLNNHTSTVACMSCHIPQFARAEPEIIYQDWSTAGEDKDEALNEFDKKTYSKMKGSFKWGKNVVPVYRWTNGTAKYYVAGDKVNPDEIVSLNEPGGDIKDPDSRIAPFKLIMGKQPYDVQNNYLITPKLYGEEGFYNTFDWQKAAENGMTASNLEFSGEVGFVETEIYIPINHSVAPANNALGCTSCHGKGGENRIDWEKIGYPDDPLKKGTREKLGLIE